MAISQSRKASAAFLFLLLLGGVLIAFFPAMRAAQEIRPFCDSLPVGTTVAELRALATARGYRFEPVVGNHVLVEHPRSLGRAYCNVGFDSNGKLSSKTADN